MEPRKGSVWKSVDWLVIGIYLILVTFGWFSVYGASYDFGNTDFLSWDSRSGKQFVWILCSLGLGFILLMLEERLYDMFAFLVYALMIGLLIVTIFVSGDVKGSGSWIVLGPVSIQPAEFAKCATALALAKYMSSYNFSMRNPRCIAVISGMILLPILIIIAQKETGSSLVYLAFLLMFYREGMPGAILFSGVSAVIYFIVSIRFGDVYLPDQVTAIGPFVVQILIILFTAGMIAVYKGERTVLRNILLSSVTLLTLALVVNIFIPYNLNIVLLILLGLLVLYLVYCWLADHNNYKYALISLFVVLSTAFLYSGNYVFNTLMQSHQQIRIKVLLGMEDDPTGAGYNVRQSMIAIGSGGMTGKGFLNGTQTKLKYVPEQDTDFIFCTVGEEEGFVGSSLVLLLFMVLILRLIVLSERQTTTFGRVYGYSVVSIFFFHLFINVGMVLGLTPVIGIPLPFFSYGGSSLWGFTILLFIFLRIDAARGR